MFRPQGSGYEKENRYTDNEHDATQNDFISLQGFLVYRIRLAAAAPINKMSNQIRARKPGYQSHEKAY
jgi:hypothetical protein